MKKSTIIISILVLAIVSGGWLFEKSRKSNRDNFEAFLKKEYKKVPRYKKEDTKEAEADQPEMAALRDYFMTMDPKTRTIPRERLLKAYQQTKLIEQSKSSPLSLTWQGYESDMGGRTRMIMYDPNDATHKKVWAGGVTGGLWYNLNITSSGSPWVPVGDFWPDLAIRCMTYDPKSPLTFYIGTGEAETAIQTYRESSGLGDGIWKSQDGGQTWDLIPGTTNFAYVTSIHVRVEAGVSILYAGVASGLYEGQQHHSLPTDGLYRSADGGNTWQQVLPNITGHNVPYAVEDITISGDSSRIYIGTRPNLDGNGAATILYSNSGLAGSWTVNESFRTLILGDPTYNIPGRVVMAAAPSDPNVVYALIASGFINTVNNFQYFYCKTIMRSGDKGVTWVTKTEPTDINGQNNFAYIAWHALDVAVDPNAPNTVYIGGLDMHKSTDGGNSWNRVSDWSLMYSGGGPQYLHADQHIILYKPGSSAEMLFGTDGGVFYTGSGNNVQPVFESHSKNYTTLQFYSCAIHPLSGTPEFLGGLQDNGCLYYTGHPLTINDMVSGGDGAYCFYDQLDGSKSITTLYYNVFYIFQNGNYYNTLGDWSSGIFVNPCDLDYNLKNMYANATDFIGNYQDQMLRITHITAFNATGAFVPLHTGSQVYFSAVKYSPYSPTGQSTVFFGTQSGKLFRINHAESIPVTTDITGPNFPTANISCIAIGGSEDTLMVTFSNYGVPSVWQSYNGGQTWQDKEGNLPDMPIRWALFQQQDSKIALLATETGVWISNNLDQADVYWQPTVEGMANVRVDMLTLRKSDNTVIAATQGRGLFTATFDISTGIEKIQDPKFTVFPNPTTGIFTISDKSGGLGNLTLRVYDQSGKIISEDIMNQTATIGEKQLDLSGKTKGIYYLDIFRDGKKVNTVKVVLK
jgi:photosystem II stability/assembly factor-like uncharacterized protein